MRGEPKANIQMQPFSDNLFFHLGSKSPMEAREGTASIHDSLLSGPAGQQTSVRQILQNRAKSTRRGSRTLDLSRVKAAS